MGVYIYQSGTEKELKNAYIGEYINDPYNLLSDVIAYYEMKGNLNDRGPNQWNISTITGSYSGTDYNTFNNYRGVNTSASASTTQSITLSTWVNGTEGANLCIGSDSYSGWGLNITWKRIAAVINGSAYETTSLTSLSGWHLVTGVFDYTGRTLKFYVDRTLQYTKNLPSSGGLRGGNYILMGGASNTAGVLNGKAGITFATQNAMTQAEIQAFYDASKDIYQ